ASRRTGLSIGPESHMQPFVEPLASGPHVSRRADRQIELGLKRGFDVLHDKALNRSITFARKDRDRLGLTGLLPHRVATPRQMVERVMVNLERLPRDIDRYMLLSAL